MHSIFHVHHDLLPLIFVENEANELQIYIEN